MDDLQISWMVSAQVDQFADDVEKLRFAREWNEVKYKEVKWFYYFQLAFYILYTFSLHRLIQGQEKDTEQWGWLFSSYMSCFIA